MKDGKIINNTRKKRDPRKLKKALTDAATIIIAPIVLATVYQVFELLFIVGGLFIAWVCPDIPWMPPRK
ncbi:MAG: hypothetical protein J6Q69_05610 [Clostridia bacterium]|nr:hypothetical protein [Clostridia bacterium]